mmetsp:Transcript_426/g.1551  ORF Transcript_426/g.1551 Transcript_426/m.1551 type:complete len:371 (+) Transcript_426:209-1321(+)
MMCGSPRQPLHQSVRVPVVAVEHLHELLPRSLLVVIRRQRARLVVLRVPADRLVLRLEVIRGEDTDVGRLAALIVAIVPRELRIHVRAELLLEPLHRPLPLPQRVRPLPVRHLHRLLRRHQQDAASGNLAPVPALSARVLEILRPRGFHDGDAAHLCLEQGAVPRGVLVRREREDYVDRHIVLRALLERVQPLAARARAEHEYVHRVIRRHVIQVLQVGPAHAAIDGRGRVILRMRPPRVGREGWDVGRVWDVVRVGRRLGRASREVVRGSRRREVEGIRLAVRVFVLVAVVPRLIPPVGAQRGGSDAALSAARLDATALARALEPEHRGEAVGHGGGGHRVRGVPASKNWTVRAVELSHGLPELEERPA